MKLNEIFTKEEIDNLSEEYNYGSKRRESLMYKALEGGGIIFMALSGLTTLATGVSGEIIASFIAGGMTAASIVGYAKILKNDINIENLAKALLKPKDIDISSEEAKELNDAMLRVNEREINKGYKKDSPEYYENMQVAINKYELKNKQIDEILNPIKVDEITEKPVELVPTDKMNEYTESDVGLNRKKDDIEDDLNAESPDYYINPETEE